MQLADLCDLVAAHVNPADRPNGLYVGLEHIASGRFVRQGQGQAADVHSAKHAFQPGDVLYGKLRPYLDKAVLVSDTGICTTELLVLRPKEGIDPRFVVGVVHTPRFVQHAVAGTTGVQHPRTSWRHISSFELPDFDPEEQARIATLLWQVHDAITGNEAIVNVLDDVFKALLHKLMMGEILMSSRGVSAIGERGSAEDAGNTSVRHGDRPMASEAIARDLDALGGTPVFRGTRVPVRILIEHLEAGDRLDDFLENYPTVSRSQAMEVLERAKSALTDRDFG